MKILSVVGARPQFVKAAVVSRELAKHPKISEFLLHTGQHYDENMSAVFFRELDIPEANENLGIVANSHGEQTAGMLTGIERVIVEQKPDLVLVYGDTNSTLSAALAATKLHVPIAHVEAGLRSFNRRMPEEVNRVVTDHCSSLLFTTSSVASNNLTSEGIAAEKILEVGDVMYDAVLHYSEKQGAAEDLFSRIGVEQGKYILATIHRPENTEFEHRMSHIFEAFEQLASSHPVVLPLHPRTKSVLSEFGWLERYESSLNVIEPVGYFDMLALEQHAALIATDSGGIQKEAYYFDVPCATLRDETEWVETVDGGFNVLLTPELSAEEIAKSVQAAIAQGFPAETGAKLYGGGSAAKRIVDVILAL